jgi:hypothetical protein
LRWGSHEPLLPRLALNHDPPDHYRHESPALGQKDFGQTLKTFGETLKTFLLTSRIRLTQLLKGIGSINIDIYY